MPFWSHPTHATKSYHQWCGCPQPLAPLVSPGGGLFPRCCATCASATSDCPPWQGRRTLTRFPGSLQKRIHLVDPKMCPHKFAPLEHIVGSAHGYAMSPEPPQVRSTDPCGTPSEHRHAYKKLPPRLAHRLPTFPCYLMLPHTGVLQASMHYLFPSPAPHEVDGRSTLHAYLPLAFCGVIV